MVPIAHVLFLSACLFGIGLAIIVVKKNSVMVLMGVELLLNAANINLVAFSQGDTEKGGQLFALFIIVIAASEVAVALAIIIQAYRYFRHSDVSDIRDLG